MDKSIFQTDRISFPSDQRLISEALVDDINTDVKVALNSLARPAYAALADAPFLSSHDIHGAKLDPSHLAVS